MADLLNYLIVNRRGEKVGRISTPVYLPEGGKIEYEGKNYIILSSKVGSAQHKFLLNQGYITVVLDRRKTRRKLADPASLPLREARKAFERGYFTEQIRRFGGNISKASEFIGMERSALHRKMRSLGVLGYAQDAREAGSRKRLEARA